LLESQEGVESKLIGSFAENYVLDEAQDKMANNDTVSIEVSLHKTKSFDLQFKISAVKRCSPAA